MRFSTLIAFLAVLVVSGQSCNKGDICRPCGYYTGVSQKVDYLPGTTTGSYTTTTRTHEVWRSGDGYTTAGFHYKPDADGYFYDAPDEAGQAVKGYLTLEVILRNDSLYFDIRKPGGLSEVFEGRKAN
jgi:hypothetical protein